MKLNSLTNALPIVAAAYGRKFGVAVQVGGTVAQTDGLTIAIPAIADDPVARTLAWGYLTHEAAHVRYTDFEAVTRTAAKGPLAKGILNILEDVRVENAILGPYPGARGTLDAVNGWLIEHDQLAAPGEGDAPPAVLGNALLVMAFSPLPRGDPAGRGGVRGRAHPAQDLSIPLRAPAARSDG